MKKVLLLLVLSVFTVNAQKFRGLDKSPMDVAAYPASHKNPNKIIKITRFICMHNAQSSGGEAVQPEGRCCLCLLCFYN